LQANESKRSDLLRAKKNLKTPTFILVKEKPKRI